MLARADIKFGLYTDFLDRTLSAEEERLPGESIEDGVIRVHDALERAAAILKKRVQQGNVPEPVRSFTPQQTGSSVMEIQTDKGPDDRIAAMIADIYSCTEIKVLEGYRLLAKTKPEFQAAYDQQMEKLTNRPA